MNFRPQHLTEALLMLPLNGSLVFYYKAAVDPKNPAASLAAIVKLPPNLKRALVVVVPAPTGEKPAYRMLVIDDSAKAFPAGESRVLPLIGVETAIRPGNTDCPSIPGKSPTCRRS